MHAAMHTFGPTVLSGKSHHCSVRIVR